MYLKSLTLKGFKSFADRTAMVFDPGLTVVVGPNGSGKSNISDAVLWVLGEQSAKQLRGSAMEDVIFSGSTARKPVGLAEVTLVLDNADHVLPIDFAEVSVTRRMYRSGESEYLINGAPCRLMDITDILHDTGLGRETHSIISQGRLDSILTSRPEERRELIEEAAGISKHRRRKMRAERKLKGMDENLTRAKDISREIARQLRPLERQVDKAKRHRDLTARLKELEATLAVDDLRQLQARYMRLTARGKEADAAIELAQYRLDERSRDLERYQSLLEQKGIFVGDLGEQRRRMQDLLGRMGSDMRLLEEKGKNMVSRLSEMRMALSAGERQRAESVDEHARVASELREAKVRATALEVRVGELEAGRDRLGARRAELGRRQARLQADQAAAQREADQETLAYAKLQDQIGNAEVEDGMYASRIAQIDEELATTGEALEECARRAEELSAQLEAATSNVTAADEAIRERDAALVSARKAAGAARERLTQARATLAALESVEAQSESASERVSSIMGSEASSAVECRLADVMRVPAELEDVVERLLGDDVAALVVATADDARALTVAAITTDVAGAATIISRQAEPPHDDVEAPGIALSSLVGAEPGAEAMVGSLLGDVRLVDEASEALAGHASMPACTYVARDGVAVLPDGRIVVGSATSDAHGALERKRKMRALRDGMSALEAEADDAAEAARRAEDALAAAREAQVSAKGEVSRLTAEERSLIAEMGRLDAQRGSNEAERASISKSRAAAAERAELARSEIGRHRSAAEAAGRRAEELASELEEAVRERRVAGSEEAQGERLVSEAKLELATIAERRNHLAVREEELGRAVGDLAERRESLMRSARSLEVLRLRVDPLHDRYEALHERALAWAVRLKDRASLAEADSDSLKATINEAREAVNAASAELEDAKSAAGEVRIEVGRLEVQVEAAIGAIGAVGYVLEDALELPEPDDREAMERSAERLRREIEGIGPVNEVAMDEYLRLKERADYIDEQVADLEAARKSLMKITSAIERKMRRQFLIIFDAVNANFAETFALLFPGGHAHLEMTDPDHLDETGIEVVAQPRGKRIQKMMLMSGGEKSLTALALLFATYKTRTVPFYVFDEVEAALDDSNLSKLLDAIEQLKVQTQLIVISHQRRTMEQADVLYGVSMHSDGVSHVVSQRLDQTAGRVVEA